MRQLADQASGSQPIQFRQVARARTHRPASRPQIELTVEFRASEVLARETWQLRGRLAAAYLPGVRNRIHDLLLDLGRVCVLRGS